MTASARNLVREERRKDFAIAGGLALFTAMFLSLFRAVELSPVSLGNALSAVGVPDPPVSFWYPPHLLFIPILRLFYTPLSSFLGCDIRCAGQVHSIGWAIVAVVCMYLLVRRFTSSVLLSLTAAVTLLVSNTFWVFATQLEPYVAVAGCLMLLTVALVFGVDRWPRRLHIVSCASIWALAALYHQANAVFLIPLTVYLLQRQGRQGWLTSTWISLLAGIIVIATYGVAYRLAGSTDSFVGWVLALANTPLTDWGSFTNFHLSGLRQGLYSQVMSLVVLPDEVRPYQEPLLWRGALLILAVLGWNAIQTVRRGKLVTPRLFLLTWWAVDFLFFVWWDPRVHKFFLPSALPIIALGGLTLSDMWLAIPTIVRGGYRPLVAKVSIGTAVAVLVGSVFIFTLLGSVMPLRGDVGPALGPHYRVALQMRDLSLAEGGCIVYGYGHQVVNLGYYFGWEAMRIRSERSLYEAYYRHWLGQPPAMEQSAGHWPDDESCAVVDSNLLRAKHFKFKTSEYMASAEWPAFLDWFVRASYSPTGDSVTIDRFYLIPPEGDRKSTFVVVDRTARENVNRGYVVKSLARLEDTPGNDGFPGRDRRLIFGYSGNLNTTARHESLWRALLRAAHR
jgi:hypothetical protein